MCWQLSLCGISLSIGARLCYNFNPNKTLFKTLSGQALMLDDYFRQYGLVAIFVAVSFIVPTSMLLMSWMSSKLGLRPNNPTAVKLETYECGVQPIGGRWSQYNFRYYMYAILFVVFDVEVVFLYPWATKFLSLELFAMVEMAAFVMILLVGWAYAWRKRDLEWG